MRTVGRKDRRRIHVPIPGEAAKIAAVCITNINLVVAVFTQHVGQGLGVGRPGGGNIEAHFFGKGDRLAGHPIKDVKEGITVFVGKIGNFVAVGRQLRLDGDGVVLRNLLHVCAIIVGHIDFFTARSACAETDFRRCDARRTLEIPYNLLGEMVGGQTGMILVDLELQSEDLVFR